ncbi:MAG: hypothetical protein ACJAV2_004903 [Myxococcota bacterium]|jgi:hypothetical protein
MPLRFEHLDDDWKAFAADYALPAVLPRLNQAPTASEPLDPAVRRLLSHIVATAFSRCYAALAIRCRQMARRCR